MRSNQALTPWLDVRPYAEFFSGHLPGSAHVDWTDLQQCLNALPAPPAQLNLVAKAQDLVAASAFLTQKGYQLVQCLDEVQLAQQPGLVTNQAADTRLWAANPLLQQACQTHLTCPGFALDVGCGGGRDAVFLAQQGWQVLALDNQARVLHCAERLAKANQVTVDWRCVDVNQASQRPTQDFDLIVMIRFLNRHLFDYIRHHLRPGGYLLVQTFTQGVEAFSSPKNPNFILKPDELAKEFSAFEVIIDKIDTLADGRPVASFLARRPKGE